MTSNAPTGPGQPSARESGSPGQPTACASANPGCPERSTACASGDPCQIERAGRTLRRAGIVSPEQLRQLRADQLGALPGIGPVQAALIGEALARGDDALVEALVREESPVLAGPRPLTERERAALRLRYRPDGTVERSVCAVAAGLGVSAPRAIQLVTHATARLLEIARAARSGRPLAPAVERDRREFRPLTGSGRPGKSTRRSLADSA